MNLAGATRSVGRLAGTSFQVIGVEQAIRNIDRVVNQENAYIKRQMKVAAINVQREAKRKTPVDTGRLRSSIRFSIVLRGYGAIVFSDVDYAKYIEYGTGIYASNGRGRRTPWMYFSRRYGWVRTRGIKPRFMMRDAWIQEKPQLMRRLSHFGGI